MPRKMRARAANCSGLLRAFVPYGAMLCPGDIRETVTFLDPGFHETTQEEFDGDIKDRPTSLKDIKKMGGSIIVGR